MENRHLSRKAERAKSEIEDTVYELIDEIENLESILKEKEVVIKKLQAEVEELKNSK